jgi:hypothetical protein
VDAKGLFFPLHTPEAAREQLEQVVHQAPACCGLERSRWWLDGLRQAVDWLHSCSLPAIHAILRRLGIVYKRGRRAVHSPDPEYSLKLALVHRALVHALSEPKCAVLLFEDEFTYYRRPTVAQGYAVRGSDGPRAEQGLGPNTKRRIAGSLNARTGEVVAWQRTKFDRWTLIRYYKELEAAYPDARIIYVVQDNWPVHAHADVKAYVEQSRIEVLALPTYAPWTNPIEKVWRKLYGEVVHQHGNAEEWSRLVGRVESWLEQWRVPSPSLLRYVGLCPG